MTTAATGRTSSCQNWWDGAGRGEAGGDPAPGRTGGGGELLLGGLVEVEKSEATHFIFRCLPSVQDRRVSECVSFQLVYGSEKITHLEESGWLENLWGSIKSPLGRIHKTEICPFSFPSVLPRFKPIILTLRSLCDKVSSAGDYLVEDYLRDSYFVFLEISTGTYDTLMNLLLTQFDSSLYLALNCCKAH